MPNIYQVAMFNAERYPDKVAVSDERQALSFGQFCARAPTAHASGHPGGPLSAFTFAAPTLM